MASSSLPIVKAGDVKDAIRDLFTTKKFSDLGIYCRGKFWDVHQAVVCMRSGVLETFCVKAGRQSQGKLHIDLSDYESEVIASVLEFAYLDQYEYSGEDGVMFHNKVFIAAYKFDMLGLQKMAVDKYLTASLKIFQVGAWEKNFCAAARLLWTELKDGEGKELKTVVVGLAKMKIELLLGSEGKEFRKLGLEIPEVAMAVLEAVFRVEKVSVLVEEVSAVAKVVEDTPESSVLSTDLQELPLPDAPQEEILEVPEVPEVRDQWPEWANHLTSPKKARKDKKTSSVTIAEEVLPAEADDEWSSFAPSMKKKNNVVCMAEEPVPEEIAPALEPYDGWGALSSKKNKKKKTTHVVEEPLPEVEVLPDTEQMWGSSFTSKKDKKKGVMCVVEESLPEDPEPDVEVTSSWGDFASSKKDKKKKGAICVVEEPLPEDPEPDVEVANSWGAFASSKKDKKKKAPAWSEPGY